MRGLKSGGELEFFPKFKKWVGFNPIQDLGQKGAPLPVFPL